MCAYSGPRGHTIEQCAVALGCDLVSIEGLVRALEEAVLTWNVFSNPEFREFSGPIQFSGPIHGGVTNGLGARVVGAGTERMRTLNAPCPDLPRGSSTGHGHLRTLNPANMNPAQIAELEGGVDCGCAARAQCRGPRRCGGLAVLPSRQERPFAPVGARGRRRTRGDARAIGREATLELRLLLEEEQAPR